MRFVDNLVLPKVLIQKCLWEEGRRRRIRSNWYAAVPPTLCVTNAPKSVGGRGCRRGRERGRPLHDAHILPVVPMWWVNSVCRLVLSSLLFFNIYISLLLLTMTASRLTAPYQIFANGSLSWGSLLLRTHLSTVCDWDYVESRLSGRRCGSCLVYERAAIVSLAPATAPYSTRPSKQQQPRQ